VFLSRRDRNIPDSKSGCRVAGKRAASPSRAMVPGSGFMSSTGNYVRRSGRLSRLREPDRAAVEPRSKSKREEAGESGLLAHLLQRFLDQALIERDIL
jgi:hypothetical protein